MFVMKYLEKLFLFINIYIYTFFFLSTRNQMQDPVLARPALVSPSYIHSLIYSFMRVSLRNILYTSQKLTWRSTNNWVDVKRAHGDSNAPGVLGVCTFVFTRWLCGDGCALCSDLFLTTTDKMGWMLSSKTFQSVSADPGIPAWAAWRSVKLHELMSQFFIRRMLPCLETRSLWCN